MDQECEVVALVAPGAEVELTTCSRQIAVMPSGVTVSVAGRDDHGVARQLAVRSRPQQMWLFIR